MRGAWFAFAVMAFTYAPISAFATGSSPLANADARPPRAPSKLLMQLSRTSGPENVVYGFFDEASGERVARLQIARLNLDYGKQGVFRVAWKPRAVMQGAQLKLFDAAAWPSVAAQLERLLQSLAPREAVIVRDFSLEREGSDEKLVTAQRAELTADGVLVLHEARVGEVRHATLQLPLREGATLQPFSPFTSSVSARAPPGSASGESSPQP